jgi:hypothetical protein
MDIVNGYPCRDCADVALAKRNVDPAKPRQAIEPPNAEAAAGLRPTMPASDPRRLLDVFA